MEAPLENQPIDLQGNPLFEIKNNWAPIQNEPAISEVRAILNGKKFDKKGNPITLIDLPSFPRKFPQTDILNWAEDNIGYEGKNSLPMLKENSENFLKFIKDQFNITFPYTYLDNGFDQAFDNEKKFNKFIQRLTNTRVNQMRSALNLVITKGLWIENVFQQEGFQKLEKDTNKFYNEIFKPLPNEENPRFVITEGLTKNNAWGKVQIITDKNSIVDANMGVRGKNPGRTKEKMLRKPKYNLQEAITDGNALRLEVKSIKDIELLVPFLTDFLKIKFNASELELKSNNLLKGKNEIQKFKEIAQKKSLKFKKSDNPNSAENYGSLNLLSTIEIPRTFSEDKIQKRKLEIQIVLVGNSNEDKLANHMIYEPTQQIDAVSRLFGTLPNQYIKDLSNRAERRVPYKLERYFLEKKTVKIYPSKINKISLTSQEYQERVLAEILPNIPYNPIRKIITKKQPKIPYQK